MKRSAPNATPLIGQVVVSDGAVVAIEREGASVVVSILYGKDVAVWATPAQARRIAGLINIAAGPAMPEDVP